MTKLTISAFDGAALQTNPRLLPDNVGVMSVNQRPGFGDFRPWNGTLSVATVGTGRKTIYRMGRDTASDSNYWLSWTSTVHVVRGFNSADVAERTFYTGDGYPKFTDTTIALGASPPTAFRAMGLPAPLAAPGLTASGGTGTTTEVRSYTYTYVNSYGFESAPSPTAEITLLPDATVSITGFSAAPSGSYNITAIRIYRTEATTDGANFFFLREIGIATSTTTDDNRDLGEVLPTVGWLPAPGIPQGGAVNATEPALVGLIGLWNGMMAGISGRGVRFCVPFSPYAWPISYDIQPADYSPVALGSYDQNLVILTTGNPHVAVGGSPDAMDEQPVAFMEPCVSVRSVASMDHGVVWASPSGIAYLGRNGARVLTTGVFSKEQWASYNPSTMVGCYYDGLYFAFYDNGTKGAIVIDPLKGGACTFVNIPADAAYADDLQRAMFILDGTSVKKWNAGGAALVAEYTTKVIQLPKPTTAFRAAQVMADAYPLTFKLYADGALVHTQTVTSQAPFRLPTKRRYLTVQANIQTQNPVLAIELAHSMTELQNG